MLSLIVDQILKMPKVAKVAKVTDEPPMCSCGLRPRVIYGDEGRYAAYCRPCGNKKSKERYIKRQLKLKGQAGE